MFARDDLALVLADVGQRPDAGDVADRPQALARAQMCVDRDAPAVGFDADRLQPEPLDTRAPAGGHEQSIAAQLATVVELQDVVLALATAPRRLHAEHELDPVAAQRLAERLAQRRGLAREHVLGPLDKRHLATEATHDLRQLDAGGSAAEHEQPPRDGLHAGRLACAPDAFELAQARDRRNDRIGAGCDDDVLGRVAHTVDLDHAPVPASRPLPRNRSIPLSASQRCWPASE